MTEEPGTTGRPPFPPPPPRRSPRSPGSPGSRSGPARTEASTRAHPDVDTDLAWVPVVADDAPPDPSGRWWHAEQGSLNRPWLWPLATVLFSAVTIPLDSFLLREEFGPWAGAAATVGVIGVLVFSLAIAVTIRRRRDRWIVVDDDRLRAGLVGHVRITEVERMAIHRGHPRIWLVFQQHIRVARAQLTWWDPALVKVKSTRGWARFLLVGTAHPDALVAALQHARRRAGLPAVPVTDNDGPYVLEPGSAGLDIPSPSTTPPPTLPPPPPPTPPVPPPPAPAPAPSVAPRSEGPTPRG